MTILLFKNTDKKHYRSDLFLNEMEKLMDKVCEIDKMLRGDWPFLDIESKLFELYDLNIIAMHELKKFNKDFKEFHD